ncbi:MAG: hypothetical protein ACJ760_10195 [Thermoleophilaceae bacterium]
MRSAAVARLAIPAVLLLAAGASPPGALAAQKSTTCANLQSTIDGSADGDVITISEASCALTSPLTLPIGHSPPLAITIRGSGTGTTLDGSGLSDRILTGDVTAPNVIDVTLSNLVFRDGTAPAGGSGGALHLTGNVGVTLDNDRFFDNKSDASQPGGAVYVQSTRGGTTVVRDSTFGDGTTAGANTAGRAGGALAVSNSGTAIEITSSSFRANSAGFPGGGLSLATDSSGGAITLDHNTIAFNQAGFSGGGADILGHPVTLRRNVFRGNSLHAGSAGFTTGGGLNVSAAGVAGVSLTQFGNVFDANAIDDSVPDAGPRGGGERIGGFQHITSLDDHFTSNTLPAPLGTGEAYGAGLAMEGCEASSTDVAELEARNLVAAGNSGSGNVDGAGVYVGCDSAPTALTLLDSTVTGNTVGAGVSEGGIAGDGDDAITLRNSIVTANPNGLDAAGFSSWTVTTSDVCGLDGSTPLLGAGNICAAPKLRDTRPGHADVHQTAASPTLDRGSNATVPAALKFDYEGQRRILGPAVDMGADELLDAVRPKVLALAIKPAVFVPGSARATLSFRLSERARLAFTVARVRPGRRVKGHCVKRTKANAGKPKCKRLVPQGGFFVQAAAGRGSTQFDGRVGPNQRKLAPGTYRISAVAVDVQGNRSASRSTTVRLEGQH